MKSYPAPPVPVDVVDAMRRLAEAGMSQDELIQQMRDAGLSIVPSIQLLKQFFKLSHADAKQAVHHSTTWSDCLHSNEALHETAAEIVDQLPAEGEVRQASLQSA